MDALPTALAASVGRSSTATVKAGRSGDTSTRRTESLRERQDERALRRRDAAQQRLEEEAVRGLQSRLEPVGQPERGNVVRRREDGQAVGLVRPELIVVDQVVEGLLDESHSRGVGAAGAQAVEAVLGHVLQDQPVVGGVGRDGGRGQVDGETDRVARLRQPLNLGAGGDVNVQHGFSLGRGVTASRLPAAPPLDTGATSFRAALSPRGRPFREHSWEGKNADGAALAHHVAAPD